jgi:hypothetical protein
VRSIFLNFHGEIVSVTVIGLMFLTFSCHAQQQQRPNAFQESSVKSFLQSFVGVPLHERDKITRYSAVFVDLKADSSQEVIVYLTGPSWCGTGGCTMLILAPEGTSYKVVTITTVMRLPIRVLTTKTNGWHDISVEARAEGEVKLSFDGKTYPSNPTVPPARPLRNKVPGRVVISDTTENMPLF